tara:strand:+ start:539 stop:673 length:135 start_codon:yes stop_codon:yes gene_type:complete
MAKNKIIIVVLLLALSSCNITSKDFYTTEPVLTGVIAGVIVNLM